MWVLRRVADLDQSVTRRVAKLPPGRADDVLRVLTKVASHSVLWLCLAALLGSRRGPTRRAAFRGVAAIAATSMIRNMVAVALPSRRRPAPGAVPGCRAMADRPTSSSFPSGHAASAAAFGTAVLVECPPAGAVVAPLAAAVGYSRVHIGQHWTSDVVAGAALGTSVALATQRWWPVRPTEPARARARVHAAVLPDGEGLALVYNPRSGKPGDQPSEEIAKALPSARLVPLTDGKDLTAELEAAVDQGTRAVGVAGGDGSVAAAAAVAAERGLPLVILPTGTFNHFARDVGVDSVQDAVEAVNAGTAVTVDLAWSSVGDRRPEPFLNTASLGGYPDLVRLRERWQPRWGKWLAAGAALIRVLAEARPLHVRLNGRRTEVWILFVGNGIYHPRGMAPVFRPRLDTGLLDVRYLRADVPLSRTRFVLAALSGALWRSRSYRQLEVRSLRVEVLGEPVALATDGEVERQGTQFEFRVAPRPLTVYRP